MADDENRQYKIGEVCKLAEVQPYVLRYWETEFPSLTPAKSGGGQRMYSRREIDIILRIKQLLYSEGFTIAGAKKKLDLELSQPVIPEPARNEDHSINPNDVPGNIDLARTLARVKKELVSILEMLAR